MLSAWSEKLEAAANAREGDEKHRAWIDERLQNNALIPTAEKTSRQPALEQSPQPSLS
jgi:hypothetical protein